MQLTRNEFDRKMSQFILNISVKHYLCEIVKTNGQESITKNTYSEFLTIFKENTLADLHKSISLQFDLNTLENIQLFVMHPYSNNKIYIPNDPHTTLRRFILNNNITAVFYSNLPYNENDANSIPPVYFIYIEDNRYVEHNRHNNA